MGETSRVSFGKKTILIICISVIVIAGALVLRLRNNPSGEIPSSVTDNISAFQPYFFQPNIPDSYVLNKKTITLSNNILMFRATSKDLASSITVTEQAAPSAVTNNSYPDAKNVGGVDGKAFIVFGKDQTMAGFISPKRNNRQTLVIITSRDTVPQNTLEDLLRALRPIR